MFKPRENHRLDDSTVYRYAYVMERSMKPGILTSIVALVVLPMLTACNQGDAKNITPNPQPPAETGRNFKMIHVYVALCDNESQGIAPVPAKIGNGDDPANNLYWGCTDGARSYFSNSALWKRLSVGKAPKNPQVLERLVFQHKRSQAIMVVDAWQGSSIKTSIDQFCQSAAGQRYESIAIKDSTREYHLNLEGGADFLAFIGHNGLMEFRVPTPTANPHRTQKVDVAVLCCKSKRFFANNLSKAEVRPVCMTASNMYPGAFILHDVLEGWFRAEDRDALRLRAAKAYAKNQNISTKSALNVFAPLP
ncbi:MAG: hypothetical protein H7A51_01980 [Akkermansiaceae bacterium]|nr:hypothetical protein [Akkermansiaceae bacterium]